MKKTMWVIGSVCVLSIVGVMMVSRSTPTKKMQEFVEITPTSIIQNVLSEEVNTMTSQTPTATTAPAAKSKTYNAPPAMSVDENKTYKATIVTSKGTMVLDLFVKDAPITVNNFVFLAREGFYADTVFHRIIKGFMIQGGDPIGNGTGGPGYRFEDEPVMREYTKGTIAMANAGPDTNGSQFFIMHADYALPKNYTIFGSIDKSDTASLAVLDAIGQSPVAMSQSGEQSKPTEKIVVQSVTIVEK